MKKKIIIIIAAAAAVAAVVFGIGMAVKLNSASTAYVVSVEELGNYFGYYEEGESLNGYVDGDAMQSVYVTNGKTIEMVNVTVGMEVKKGDVLLRYNSEEAELELENQKLSLEKLELQLKAAQMLLANIESSKPVAADSSSDEASSEAYDEYEDYSDYDDTDTDDEEDTDEEEDPDDTDEKYTDVKAYTTLGSDSLPYNLISDDAETIITTADIVPVPESDTESLGSKNNPYRFLVSQGTVITPDFMNMLVEAGGMADIEIIDLDSADSDTGIFEIDSDDTEDEEDTDEASERMVLYVALEIHENNDVNDTLLAMWKQNFTENKMHYSENWIARIVTDSGHFMITSEIIPLPTPTVEPEEDDAEPTETPESEDSVTTTPVAEFSSLVKLTPVYASATLLSESDITDSSSGKFNLTPPSYSTWQEINDAIDEQKNTISELELEIRAQQLAVKNAEKAASEGLVKAEIDGTVTKVSSPENIPTDGSAFIEILANGGVSITAGLPETSYDKLSVGDTVYITSYIYGTYSEGRIDKISSYPDTSGKLYASGSQSVYPVTIVSTDPEAEFHSGDSSIYITFDSSATEYDDSDMVCISSMFILDEDDGNYVFKRNADGLLEKVKITTGKSYYGTYEVTSGLEKSDYIAFPFGDGVEEGCETKEATYLEMYEKYS